MVVLVVVVAVVVVVEVVVAGVVVVVVVSTSRLPKLRYCRSVGRTAVSAVAEDGRMAVRSALAEMKLAPMAEATGPSLDGAGAIEFTLHGAGAVEWSVDGAGAAELSMLSLALPM